MSQMYRKRKRFVIYYQDTQKLDLIDRLFYSMDDYITSQINFSQEQVCLQLNAITLARLTVIQSLHSDRTLTFVMPTVEVRFILLIRNR